MEWLTAVPVYGILFATLYFEVFLVYTYFEERSHFKHQRVAKRAHGAYPTVTVIVPAWNEEKTLAKTIQSLLALEYPKKKLSIFIVNDGSTDNTLAVAREFERYKHIRVFTKANGGKHTAMNLGIEHSNADLVGCLDADSFVHPKALMNIVEQFTDKEVMAVTPSVQIYTPQNWLQHIQAVEYMVGQFTRKVLSRIHALYVTPGPFSFYRRDIFEKIGGFVHGYGTEDMEMAMRMQAHHMRIENAHGALVYTVSPRTIPVLYKQRVRWVSGFLKNALHSYRYMFFNKQFGDFGFLIFPFALISIFAGLFFSLQYVQTLATTIYERYVEYTALGVHFNFGMPTIEWFTLNVEFNRLLIYLLLFVTLLFIVAGTVLVKQRFVFSRGIIFFILMYGLLAPFWLAKSVYNLLVARNAQWR